MDDLIHRARHGDAEAFAALFEHNKDPLWRAAMAVLGNVDDAADALQETAVKAWRAMPRFGGRSSLGTWLMRILLRTCVDVRRARMSETPWAMEASGDAGAFDEARALVGRGPTADRDEVMDVRAAIARLSADDRAVLSLFYVSDFPTRRIADILNLSEGATRTRLVRARERFKAAYLGEGAEQGRDKSEDDEDGRWKAEVAR
ncbi:RNA polymerase sigma factor [Arabiibacter massiliensis]|uniref:RNA polymerase sigma factor n=1 Tax=Arabiibacter massiliensis TaxID=1870985 RepID=UPI0009B9B909|nr:sigma-70 family RNA polymerase sigma factor [Arabiibacter massiliensis]